MNIPDAATIAGYGAGLGTFLASFGGAAYAVIQRIRRGAIKKASDDHKNIDAQIEAAVNKERDRQAELRNTAGDATEAWKELAMARKEKIDEFAAQIAKLQEDCKRLGKTNGILSRANAELTVEVSDLRKRTETLEAIAKALPQLNPPVTTN